VAISQLIIRIGLEQFTLMAPVSQVPYMAWNIMPLCSRHKHLKKNGLFTLKKLKIDPFQQPKSKYLIDISYFVVARPHQPPTLL
jgi:hypothetical protein